MTVMQLKTNLKFEKSSAVLDGILSIQRTPLDKTSLGFDSSQKNVDESANPVTSEKKEKSQSYANALKCENNNRKRIKEQQEHDTFSKNRRNEFIRAETSRRPLTVRYESIFPWFHPPPIRILYVTLPRFQFLFSHKLKIC